MIQKWKYLQKVGFKISDEEMNKFGGEGWELCGFSANTNIASSGVFVYVFKRPIDLSETAGYDISYQKYQQ